MFNVFILLSPVFKSSQFACTSTVENNFILSSIFFDLRVKIHVEPYDIHWAPHYFYQTITAWDQIHSDASISIWDFWFS